MIVTDIERAAWSKRDDADKHAPSLALKITLDDIERGALTDVRHICVVVVRKDADVVTFYQAGDLSELAVEGALGRVIRWSQGG